MFRESSAIDSERTASGVRALYAKYSENEEWFTGTPDSVDRRIAQCKRISNAAKAASVRLAGRNAGIQYIALAQEMDSDRTALEGLRRDLLTASSDRYAEEGFSYGHGDDTVDKGTIDGPPPGGGTMGSDLVDHQDHLHQGSRYAADVATPQPTPVNDGSGPPMESPLAPPAPVMPPAPQQQPTVMASRLRPEARFFIAEQECDDLGELLIRAQNHAERVSSTLPARQSRAHVAAFVEAVREAAAPYSDPDRKKGWDWDKGHRPSEDSTEHGDVSHDGVANKPRSRQASLNDFPADLMYLE